MTLKFSDIVSVLVNVKKKLAQMLQHSYSRLYFAVTTRKYIHIP
jgi:hypothetical protein